MRTAELIGGGAEGAQDRPAYHSSRKQDWETPPEVFDPLHAEFGFTLDVCALPENAKVPRFFTPQQNGLVQPWAGVCWMNPPYKHVREWMHKAVAAAAAGCTVVALVPVRPDSSWWHKYVWDFARHRTRPGVQLRFIQKRIRFVGGRQRAPFSSCIVVFQPQTKEP